MNYSNILLDEQPLIVVPKLAVLLGLNEALVLQQLHYWVNKSTNIRSGKKWVYNSIIEWHKQFPFWSSDTVKRTLAKLVDSGLVIKNFFNKSAFDRTLWYTIDYAALNKIIDEKTEDSGENAIGANCTNQLVQIETNSLGQIAPINLCNGHQPIPETNTENISETTQVRKKVRGTTALPVFDELVIAYTPNQKLRDAIFEFIKMRVSIKKAPTNRALEIIFEKLDKFAKTDLAKIEILNRSIVNNWQDVFELKPPQGSFKAASNNKKSGNSPLEDLEDFLREERDD